MRNRKKWLKAAGTVLAIIAIFLAGRYSETPPVTKYKIIDNKVVIARYANLYLTASSYSEKGLIKALTEYENCDEKVVQNVVDKMNIDWQKQADKELSQLLNSTGYSEKQVRAFMARDLYTQEQIDASLESASPDWKKQAKVCADRLIGAGLSELNVKTTLLSRGFTLEQID